MADPGWKRLGEAIYAERTRRWRRRADFASACGLKVRVITALENGERTNFSPETIAAVEATLGWAAGSAERVRRGQRPLRPQDPALARLTSLWPRLSADARRMLLRLAEDAVDPRT